jgi:hypothetical protein
MIYLKEMRDLSLKIGAIGYTLVDNNIVTLLLSEEERITMIFDKNGRISNSDYDGKNVDNLFVYAKLIYFDQTGSLISNVELDVIKNQIYVQIKNDYERELSKINFAERKEPVKKKEFKDEFLKRIIELGDIGR